MKKLFVLTAAIVFAAACAGNRNILNTKMSKYPAEKYITKIASSKNKKEAKEAALTDLKKLFDSLPPAPASDVRRESILARAYTAQWWKDKDSGKYYAIAVLEREPALTTMKPFYTSIDSKLGNLQQRIEAEGDKFVRLKEAAKMQPLFEERENLDREYRLLSFNASSFDEDKLYSYKSTYNKTFYDVKINAIITGTDDSAVKSYIIDALNSLGFAVGENLTNYDIELTVKTSVKEVPSKTTQGLHWSRATAEISLKDMSTGGTFVIFTRDTEDGSYATDKGSRRALITLGADSAPVIKLKLLEYVEKK
jgi:hypothetical protein